MINEWAVMNINISANQGDVGPDRRTILGSSFAPTRCVLVVGGNPEGEPRYRFEEEWDAVNRCLWPAAVDVRYVPLDQITQRLDEHRPLVLHLAAHASMAGIHLSGGQRPVLLI